MSCEPFVSDEVGHIPLWGRDEQGERVLRAWAIVDACDFEDVVRFRWHMTDTGYASRWYGGRPPKRKRDRMHRRILGLAPEDPRRVDHINRNRLDNRRFNLRTSTSEALHKQNLTPREGGTSPYRGVYWDGSRGKWVAQAICGKQRLHRRFPTEEAARDAAIAWRAEHMPFAVA